MIFSRRAEELIACELLPEDKKDGPIHGWVCLLFQPSLHAAASRCIVENERALFSLTHCALQISHGMDVLHWNIKPDITSGEWNTIPGMCCVHSLQQSYTIHFYSMASSHLWLQTEFLYNWESPQAAQPAGNHLSRLFHFRGDYSLDADYSLNYFQWNKPEGIGSVNEAVGSGVNPFLDMFETRTGLFQVVYGCGCGSRVIACNIT